MHEHMNPHNDPTRQVVSLTRYPDKETERHREAEEQKLGMRKWGFHLCCLALGWIFNHWTYWPSQAIALLQGTFLMVPLPDSELHEGENQALQPGTRSS